MNKEFMEYFLKKLNENKVNTEAFNIVVQFIIECLDDKNIINLLDKERSSIKKHYDSQNDELEASYTYPDHLLFIDMLRQAFLDWRFNNDKK